MTRAELRQLLGCGVEAAAIGHALAFGTWRSLVREQGLDREEAVDLMARLVTAALDPQARR